MFSISALPAGVCVELRCGPVVCHFHLRGFLLGYYILCLLRGVRLHLYLEQDQEDIHHTNTAPISSLTNS